MNDKIQLTEEETKAEERYKIAVAIIEDAKKKLVNMIEEIKNNKE